MREKTEDAIRQAITREYGGGGGGVMNVQSISGEQSFAVWMYQH